MAQSIELHVEDFEARFKGYLVMEMNGNVLCFWGGNEYVFKQPYFERFSKDTPRGYGVELVIEVKDIKQFYEAVKDGANVAESLVKQPWGLWDFRAVDPAGYYLRFTSEHDILDPSNAVT